MTPEFPVTAPSRSEAELNKLAVQSPLKRNAGSHLGAGPFFITGRLTEGGMPQSKERMEESEARAVARARAGDADAFRLLVERHSHAVFGLAYRMTGNEQDAEDVVQETFLNAYRRIGRFESRSGFGTWLYRITVNCSLDLIRSRQRHRSAEGNSDENWLASVAAPDPTPDRLAFSEQIQQKVAEALEALSPMERAAFVLRHYEGLSIEQIGEALGRRSDATKNCVFRAVHKLRRALEPALSSARCST